VLGWRQCADGPSRPYTRIGPPLVIRGENPWHRAFPTRDDLQRLRRAILYLSPEETEAYHAVLGRHLPLLEQLDAHAGAPHTPRKYPQREPRWPARALA